MKASLRQKIRVDMVSYIKTISIVMVMFCCSALAQVPTTTEVETINVGVLATRGDRAAIERWQPLMDWLTARIPNAHFQLHPYTLEQMAAVVKSQDIDFIITNPGQSVQLGRQYPLSWLATLRSRYQEGTSQAIGSAFVVRADSPYQHLSDMKGKSVAAVSKIAFGGYLTLKREMQQAGHDPERFFSTIDFTGFPLDAIVYKLRDGDVDGAVLPVCQLEDMVREGLIAGKNYRVLDNQAPDGFPCQASTRLYPNWSFAKTGKTSEALAKQISRALLALPEDHPAAIAADSLGWTTPISQLTVDKLYQDLDIHPLQNPWWKEALVWLKANQQWGWLLIILIVVLNGYHFLLEYRFNKNQKRLLRVQNELNEKIAMLEHAQRVAIVGELGASIAHEISQPLAAIQNYSQGGLIRVNKGKPVTELQPVLEHIQHQVMRASDIVQRLRGLINKRASEKKWSDVVDIIDDTLLLLRYELEKSAISVTVSHEGEGRPVWIDLVGFQQLILNIIKNAIDACNQACSLSATIAIELVFTPQQLVVRVTDSGEGFAVEPALLQSAFYSTKAEGLGLGLAICRDVVKSHHGHMEMCNVAPHGCRVEVTFPFIDNEQ
ncbi:sensor histidine kinase [Pragia fontium]|nr:sensor histidine kinase [Pragia fontium]